MEKSFGSRLKNVFSSFFSRDPTIIYRDVGSGYGSRPDRHRLSRGNEKTIITSIYNRIALDVAGIEIMHCKTDDDGRFLDVIKDGLNSCLTFEANIDQDSRSFIQDAALSMFDEGCVALVAVDTTADPAFTDSYDVLSMRTGKIIQWYPKHVKVNVYNDRTGRREDIILSKSDVAIVENPFYAVMNEPNSTAQRLKRKLALLDVTDEQTASGKLDIIIQLPYVIKSQAKRDEAEKRRKEIEMQLAGSKYGIAYADGTERITQLNRPVENNLMAQVESLTSTLYSQLCITPSIMDGTADDKTMLNYNTRVVEAVVAAIARGIERAYLSKTARSQNHKIMYFRDPFKLVPVNDIAEIADKLTRNEIMTSNEIRQKIGLKPSDDPKADQLRNSNLNHPDENQNQYINSQENNEEGGTSYDQLQKLRF